MDKVLWIAKACEYQEFCCSQSMGWNYCSSLYETYVEHNDDEFGDNPEGAVNEDFTYWD